MSNKGHSALSVWTSCMGAIGTYIECRVPISSPTLLENSSKYKAAAHSTDVPFLLINFVFCPSCIKYLWRGLWSFCKTWNFFI